jgi:phosphate transport system substrate-binding protein
MMRARYMSVVTATVILGLTIAVAAPAAAVTPARVNGSGSSYVALAVQQWVADAQTRGLPVNYLPTSSPDGLTSYADGLIDFAATEAEYSALVGNTTSSPADARGYQYVPDVAGATAVMYHVQDRAGRTVNYLHLSMQTIARIFMGDITNWDDPAITADNKGLLLPDQPINVVYRSGQSGTTGTFYDFVAHADPGLFATWAAKYHLPTNVRIIQLDGTPNFAPKTIAFGGSDQVVQYIASNSGMWSIGYDEFGYALVYGAQTAWVENASGHWVQPYAQNISAALEAARLRPDLSQELSGVYASQNPLAYPISAYSYLVLQCGTSADRATCKGAYPNPGITLTLAKWMQYIECDGQINMAAIGYSPLPTNLSQEISNSIARLQGGAPVQLNAGNCSNPRFHGNLGQKATSPPDPLANVPNPAPSGSNGGGSSTPGTSSNQGGGPVSGSTGSTGNTTTSPGGVTKVASGPLTPSARKGGAVAGVKGAAPVAAGGGSDLIRSASPVAYNRPGLPAPSNWPAWSLLIAIAIPPAVGGSRRLWRRRAKGA